MLMISVVYSFSLWCYLFNSHISDFYYPSLLFFMSILMNLPNYFMFLMKISFSFVLKIFIFGIKQISIGMTMSTTYCGAIIKPKLTQKLNYQTHRQTAVCFNFFKKSGKLQVLKITKLAMIPDIFFSGFHILNYKC